MFKKNSFSFEIPAAALRGGIGMVRYYSTTNIWLDFIVLVEVDNVNIVSELIDRCMDTYWKSDDLCYGDVVEEELDKSKISYTIMYHDADCDFDDLYESIWSDIVDKISSYAAKVINLW